MQMVEVARHCVDGDPVLVTRQARMCRKPSAQAGWVARGGANCPRHGSAVLREIPQAALPIMAGVPSRCYSTLIFIFICSGGSARAGKCAKVLDSVKLDDPSFPAPIYANLVAVDDRYALVWSR